MTTFKEALARLESLERKHEDLDSFVHELDMSLGSHTVRLTSLEGRMNIAADLGIANEEAIEEHEARLRALEAPAPAPEPPKDLSNYQGIFEELIADHRLDFEVLCDGYSPMARHVVDAYEWMYRATSLPRYHADALHYARRIIAAYPRASRSLDDLRMFHGFRQLGDDETNQFLDSHMKRFESWGMITGTFREWSVTQHMLPFSFNPPGGAFQGVVGYAAGCLGPSPWRDELVGAFREDVRAPGVYGAGWNEGYREARSSFKAGRDVRLTFLDPALRGVFARAWRNMDPVPGHAWEFINGLGQPVGLPLYDGWLLLDEALPLGRQVLDDVLSGKSNLHADLNTHPTGVRQLALCGAVAWAEARS